MSWSYSVATISTATKFVFLMFHSINLSIYTVLSYRIFQVYMYNDLHVYSIKKNQWTRIRAPKPPPPRTFHQAAIVSRSGGELWVFGGEFSSPSQSQFHHYNDLWMFSFGTRQWQKIQAPNGPSPRSGHRMVVLKKHLLVFGGYYDNLRF